MARLALIFLVAGLSSSCLAADLPPLTLARYKAEQALSTKHRHAPPATDILTSIQGLDGACQKLTVPERDRTSDCAGKLIATRLANGRARFYFVLFDGSTVGFTTSLDPQGDRQAEELIAPVDGVLLGSLAEATSSDAKGSCDFTDPDLAPVWVKCQASGASGQYSASFLSNASGPVDLDGQTISFPRIQAGH